MAHVTSDHRHFYNELLFDRKSKKISLHEMNKIIREKKVPEKQFQISIKI